MYPSAVRVRRWAVILAALLSGALVFVSMLVDPVPDASGEALIAGYAAHPLLQGVHTTLIHYGYALFAPVAFSLVGLVRGRGAWLANGAGLCAVLGLTTLPGLVLVDYHDVATANVAGLSVAVAASDAVGTLPGFLPLLLPALISSALSPAARRAGRLAGAPAAPVGAPGPDRRRGGDAPAARAHRVRPARPGHRRAGLRPVAYPPAALVRGARARPPPPRRAPVAPRQRTLRRRRRPDWAASPRWARQAS